VVYSPRFVYQFRAGHHAGLWYLRPARDAGATPRSKGFHTAQAAVEALRGGVWRLPDAKGRIARRGTSCRISYWQSESKQGTDAEQLTAIKRRDAILGDHPDFAASGAWGCSGNGAWILVRLADYPNDAHHASLLVKALAVLDQKYSDNIVRIDTATANPARLIGLLSRDFEGQGMQSARSTLAACHPGRIWNVIALTALIYF
jgi:hypothetical protein